MQSLKGERYLLDSNALNKVSRQIRQSTIFQELCEIPEDVLTEQRDLAGIEEVEHLRSPVTARILRYLIEVLREIPVSDTSLLDIYRREGNADPILIATALSRREDTETALFGPEYVIVSNDKAVRRLAERFSFRWCSSQDLLQILTH